MGQLLMRNVNSETIARLKTRARSNHRSLEAELRMIVETAVDQPVVDVLAEVDRIRALFSGRTFDDSTILVREDRDR